MSMDRRIGSLEDHELSPKEAVIRWLREAHQFDSFPDYGHWLLEQPEDVYPLVRMPRQVVAAVRAHNKGVPDRQLAGQFHQVQKDVLFLFHLHSEINEHAFATQEARQLRLQLLRERLRALILRTWGGDRDRLGDAPSPRAPGRAARTRKKTPEQTALEKDIVDWAIEEALLWAEVTSLKEAERLLAVRYVRGEPLLFPQAARALDEMLQSLDKLHNTYEVVLEGPPPGVASDHAFWTSGTESTAESSPRAAQETDPQVRPRTGRIARYLAERVVIKARAETLGQLGEGATATELIRNSMRSEAAEPAMRAELTEL